MGLAVNARAAVAALHIWQCRILVQADDILPGGWLRHCELCAVASSCRADMVAYPNLPQRAWRHFGITEDYELTYDTWEAAMLSARDHLAAHRRALPGQIGEA